MLMSAMTEPAHNTPAAGRLSDLIRDASEWGMGVCITGDGQRRWWDMDRLNEMPQGAGFVATAAIRQAMGMI